MQLKTFIYFTLKFKINNMNKKLKILIIYFTFCQQLFFYGHENDVGYSTGIGNTNDDDLGISNSLIENIQD